MIMDEPLLSLRYLTMFDPVLPNQLQHRCIVLK